MGLNDVVLNDPEIEKISINGPVDFFIKGTKYLFLFPEKRIFKHPEIEATHMGASMGTGALIGGLLTTGIAYFGMDAPLVDKIIVGSIGAFTGAITGYVSATINHAINNYTDGGYY